MLLPFFHALIAATGLGWLSPTPGPGACGAGTIARAQPAALLAAGGSVAAAVRRPGAGENAGRASASTLLRLLAAGLAGGRLHLPPPGLL